MLSKTFGKGKGKALKGGVNDQVMTPPKLAREIVSSLDILPSDRLLEPFRGDGAFYDAFPENNPKDWCEISEGRDFFQYTKQADWIITNPPYSIFDEALAHCFELAEEIVLLIPMSKLVSSMRRVRLISEFGGVRELTILSASKCGFPFGFPACIVHISKGYKGRTKIRAL